MAIPIHLFGDNTRMTKFSNWNRIIFQLNFLKYLSSKNHIPKYYSFFFSWSATHGGLDSTIALFFDAKKKEGFLGIRFI